ncbi:nucleotidyltransferase domain-containing protein [Leptolyngbyaceae cyanobacterium CCMR0082]|uniref:Nucleotidyltransferase domain-containing protein n=2 Tax=Adonisia turfae TaxID=2950184 RepID=A0A6M0SHA4_9CYAN|nr:nucleotidyltransferase domain-containing protein [Adonisia turfae]MDV3350684.1 nucleotidyltransferase domain-containing protein [Leptothoe sp. LEGE 181152]NEZ60236.1 nucleotidyltransferase domain-containing protein [Adonisia turfae CCMR0081]NEZ67754.1 nucleotidyltransferase domain-containing protein [Adonisia turfae CCMR0082]
MESKNLKFGLESKTIEDISSIFQQYTEIERVILYGSRAKGTYRAGSDIDLTLVGKQISHEQLLSIEHQLDDLLLPYLFDLSIFSHIEDPDVIDHINRVGLIFYEKKSSTDEQKKVSERL